MPKLVRLRMRGVSGAIRLLLTWALCGVSVAAATTAEGMATPARPLKCVTFNLLHGGVFSGLYGSGQDLEMRLAVTVEELRALDADIIGVQEASTGRGRGNIAARLAAQLGFHYAYAPAGLRVFANETVNGFISWLMNFSEGPAIISRFPIIRWQAYDLPRCGRFSDPRVLLCAEVDTPLGLLPVCSTHTSGGVCHAKAVVEVLQDRRGTLPLFLMGDFNAPEQSLAMATLTQETGLIDAFRTANPTTHGFTVWQWVYAQRPTVFRRVDYLFVLPGRQASVRIRGSRLVLYTPRVLVDGRSLWPSDHYGVFAEIEVSPLSG